MLLRPKISQPKNTHFQKCIVQRFSAPVIEQRNKLQNIVSLLECIEADKKTKLKLKLMLIDFDCFIDELNNIE